MALGAMTKYKKDIAIVPCGLNYFGGHRFRSRMIMEFGQPYHVPKELNQLYQVNKREAIKMLLKQIENVRSCGSKQHKNKFFFLNKKLCNYLSKN
jgi:glycerol-3-phosphate O-acyltransferase/dihydroxyacetone phosphate acyltransferase